MPRKRNPYIAGPPVSGRNFYGRKDIFRFVQNTFASPQQNVIVLWGQRRMGKTSVLHEMSSRLSPDEFYPLYFDLQDKAQQRLNEVLYDLAREIGGSLNLDSPPRDDFLSDDDYFHERFLPQVYQSLGTKRLLLMFDEFDILDIPEDELARDVAVWAFFPYLRRALMDDKQLTFVFVVGRRLDELDELLQSTFKMAKTASVSFLEEAEARQLVVEPASDILEYDEEAVGQITYITACHPYLTQLVCSEIFSYMEATKSIRVTVGDVEAVVDRAIAAGGAGLAWLWRGLPTAERFVLSAVAHAAREGRAATQYEIDRVLKEYRVPFSGPELTQAPDNLTRWGLLRRIADGYEFIVELLRRWILSEHSLEQAKRELESVSPRATRSYELASELHRVGELVGAIRFYKRALVINPNHVQARLGLAQALFELDRIEEAIKEYTEVYNLNEVMARDGLIAARQKRAETLEEAGQTDEADQEYKTILNIAPYDLRVRKWVADRWTARGRKCLAEGRYGEAIAEYEKATELDGPDAYEGLIAARRTWAEALEGEDRISEADQQYEAILSMAPDDDKLKEWVVGCWMARGKKYLEGERCEEAVAEYNKAVALGVSGAREGLIAARRTWAEALEREDKADEADQQYEIILDMVPSDDKLKEWVANCWMARGKKYLGGERYEDAVAEYEKAVALDVSGAREGLIAARRAWAEALEKEDKAGEADQQYDAILGIAPDDDESVREWVANSLIGRGDRCLEEGRYGEASKAYAQAEDTQPERQQDLAQRRHQLELAPDYDRAMRAHKAGNWATAEEGWAELYIKDRDYAREGGKTVAVLLAKTIEIREGISQRRQRLIGALSGLVVVVTVLSLWLGWRLVVASGQTTSVSSPTSTPYLTHTLPPTYTPHTTPKVVEKIVKETVVVEKTVEVTKEVTVEVTKEVTVEVTKEVTVEVTAPPGPPPTPITVTIVVTAIPTPTPTPTPFAAPQLIGPENEREFFEGDAVTIVLQWESVGPLAEDEWYQVALDFFKLGEIQSEGNRVKETQWKVPAYFYTQADKPKRPYYWNVTVVQECKDPDGKDIKRSPTSETWTFYWP